MVISKYVAAAAAAFLVVFLAASTAAAKTPQRIVSLSPTATEDLFAIGAGKQVVAVDDQSNYPARAPKTKLSGYTPNAEAIAAYEPDLVVVSDPKLGNIGEALRKLRIPFLTQPTARTLTEAYRQIRQLGTATGHAGRADAVATRMQKQIASLAASLPRPAKRLRVYHELDATHYSPTSKTFIGRIYTLLGLTDIADAADKTGSGYPQLSAEYIVSSNPDLIVLADGETPAKAASRPGWRTITAVQDGHVVAVDADISSRWGPRVVDFVRLVAGQVRKVAATG
jgi:iron complex transport system substrate-binding protein